MKTQILAELAKTGMYLAPGSMGDLLANGMVSQINSIRRFKAEGMDHMAEQVLENSIYGKSIKAIVLKYAAK